MFPIITIFGSLGNIITILGNFNIKVNLFFFVFNFVIHLILVLKREPMMTTLTILLIALAISDILAPQANALIGFSHYHLSHRYSNSVNFLKYYDILRYIIHPLSTMFTMSSSWIVTIATLFRLIAVMWPFKARTLIDKKVASISLLIVFGFSLASIIPIYSNLVRTKKCTSDNKIQYTALSIQITSEFLQKAYVPYIHIMSFYLPWLISLILWLFLLRSLRKSERNFNYNFTFSSRDSANLNSIYNTLDKQNSKYRENYTNETSSIKLINTTTTTRKQINNDLKIPIINETRFNNAQIRMRSTRFNKITLMVVVLCFTNLICRVFTFVFIFEAIFNSYIIKLDLNENNDNNNNNNNYESSNLNESAESDIVNYVYEDAKIRFPKFLSYSLLLNNIFLCINHSCNILIYTFTNPRFKRNLISFFKRYFLCIECFKKQNKLINNNHNNINNHEIENLNNSEFIHKNSKKRSLKQNELNNSTVHFQQNCHINNKNNVNIKIVKNENNKNKHTEDRNIYSLLCPIKRLKRSKNTNHSYA